MSTLSQSSSSKHKGKKRAVDASQPKITEFLRALFPPPYKTLIPAAKLDEIWQQFENDEDCRELEAMKKPIYQFLQENQQLRDQIHRLEATIADSKQRMTEVVELGREYIDNAATLSSKRRAIIASKFGTSIPSLLSRDNETPNDTVTKEAPNDTVPKETTHDTNETNHPGDNDDTVSIASETQPSLKRTRQDQVDLGMFKKKARIGKRADKNEPIEEYIANFRNHTGHIDIQPEMVISIMKSSGSGTQQRSRNKGNWKPTQRGTSTCFGSFDTTSTTNSAT
ncbi:hypothetical protein DFS34DRAFT_608596 [Phlyctochytrium arcticum]|nr:hypothetical protein DFS34DRAFT_608596 [Phlyctochytrium arcticum]